MAYNTITYWVDKDVAHIRFNRPEVSNGFNIPMCHEIIQVLDEIKQTSAIHLVIIDAEGSVFSVGGDLVEMERAVEDDDITSLVEIAKLVQDISFMIKQLPKPVLFCVDGPVAGAAFNLALAADFCIATQKTRFIQAFVNVGLAPDAGGLFLLTRSVGINKATHLVMTGEAVSAQEAEDYGFVYKTCEADQLEKTCQRLVKRLRRGSFNSYAAMKQLLWQSFFTQWQSYARLELDLQEQLAFKADFKEGVRAHAQRRLPKFTDDGIL